MSIRSTNTFPTTMTTTPPKTRLDSVLAAGLARKASIIASGIAAHAQNESSMPQMNNKDIFQRNARITPEIAASICIELQVQHAIGTPLSGPKFQELIKDVVDKLKKRKESPSDTEDEDVVDKVIALQDALDRRVSRKKARSSARQPNVMNLLPPELMFSILQQLWNGDVNSLVELLRASKEWQSLFPRVRTLIRTSNVIIFYGSSIASGNGIASSFFTLDNEVKIEPPIEITNTFGMGPLDDIFPKNFFWEVMASITIHMGSPENDDDRAVSGLRFAFGDADDVDWTENPDKSTNETVVNLRADDYENVNKYKGLEWWVTRLDEYEQEKRDLKKAFDDGEYDDEDSPEEYLEEIEKKYKEMSYSEWNEADANEDEVDFMGFETDSLTWGNVSKNDPGAASVCKQFKNQRFDPDIKYPNYVFKYLVPKASAIAVNADEEDEGELTVEFAHQTHNGVGFTVKMTIALTYVQPTFSMEAMWSTGDIDDKIQFKNLRIIGVQIESDS